MIQLSTSRPVPSGPTDLHRLLLDLAVVPNPRLTCYPVAGERVELSGRVLVNWVAKLGHLLREEHDLEPGTRVAVRGRHWLAPAVWLAVRHGGGEIVPEPADVVVTPGEDLVLAARGFPDVLPEPVGARADLLAPAPAGSRRLLGPDATPTQVLGCWADGGSVVWHHGLGAEDLQRVLAQEKAVLPEPG